MRASTGPKVGIRVAALEILTAEFLYEPPDVVVAPAADRGRLLERRDETGHDQRALRSARTPNGPAARSERDPRSDSRGRSSSGPSRLRTAHPARTKAHRGTSRERRGRLRSARSSAGPGSPDGSGSRRRPRCAHTGLRISAAMRRVVGHRHDLSDVVAERRHDHLVVGPGTLGSGGGLQAWVRWSTANPSVIPASSSSIARTLFATRSWCLKVSVGDDRPLLVRGGVHAAEACRGHRPHSRVNRPGLAEAGRAQPARTASTSAAEDSRSAAEGARAVASGTRAGRSEAELQCGGKPLQQLAQLRRWREILVLDRHTAPPRCPARGSSALHDGIDELIGC